jgi:hypothetical protein
MVKNKYGARKVTAPDGQVFDSQREYTRWCELKLMERAGKIKDLRRQVKYVLIPAQRDARGKLLEYECSYVADFVYYDFALQQEVVEDAKGMKTDVYKIKKKLMLWVHGIRIKES